MSGFWAIICSNCLTVRKHLNPFLLLVVVARCRALIAGELWTIWVRGWLSRWVQILIGWRQTGQMRMSWEVKEAESGWRREKEMSPFCCLRWCWWGLLFGSLALGELGNLRCGWRSPATAHWTAWLPCQLEKVTNWRTLTKHTTDRHTDQQQM